MKSIIKMSANLLTIFRIILVFFMLPFIYFKFNVQNLLLYNNSINSFKFYFGMIFILAALTDYLDGFIARRFKQQTVFGQFFDPIADKILVFISLIYLYILCQRCLLIIDFPEVNKKLENFILSFLIISNLRDFLIMGIRCVAFEQKKIINSSFLGRLKTFFIFISIILILFIEFWIKIFNIKNIDIFIHFIQIFLFLNIIFIVLSGLGYIIKNYVIIFANFFES
ncbi:MAG: CDP-diacylglycerol--glycerol-3-phosphate 3-phosphatidyltransferase [Candidatus Phytoplasma cynodontis]|uniref:CDP-alcohol phosphatidyltransferase family protein n=1 Tax='Cynodon dactylon' phytoplasma TaxID=295320 RepID=UPI001265AC6C|nr:CDP-alcohol phosphatidyltransferase family protein ['Cynodon dactylon' phytoplasma]KAB8122035.1 CDP-diacylglycerol--glycerol-3-phosphate 3-phosphatidyltransferase ['Cynodon dactylon' phytoplasma]WIA07548.1 MAG: CDP-diacylglycerol--glycerol-3-phosphate 3-phosphatidyltransferase [Candidatus Phytoplasma cynodontis]